MKTFVIENEILTIAQICKRTGKRRDYIAYRLCIGDRTWEKLLEKRTSGRKKSVYSDECEDEAKRMQLIFEQHMKKPTIHK